MIAIRGNAGGNRAAENLREIELIVSGVGPSDHDPAHGITCAMPKTSLTLLIETRVLTKQRGKDCPSPKILDGSVRPCCSITFPISFSALAITRLAVFSLADAGKKAIPGILSSIKRPTGDNSEFLLSSKGRDLARVFDGQKIREHKAKAILGSSAVLGFTRVLIHFCRFVGWGLLLRSRRLGSR